MKLLSETAIINKAQKGDTIAFRFLVETYQSMLYSLACRFLGKDDAEDTVQEAFIRLWKNIHKYKPEIKLATWLYRIVTNLCLDHLKSSHNRNTKNSIDVADVAGLKDDDAPDKALEKKEMMQQILKFSESLTPKQRAVFVLRDLEGLSSQEVCTILSMKAGSVKSNLYYARIAMGDKLKQYYSSSQINYNNEM